MNIAYKVFKTVGNGSHRKFLSPVAKEKFCFQYRRNEINIPPLQSQFFVFQELERAERFLKNHRFDEKGQYEVWQVVVDELVAVGSLISVMDYLNELTDVWKDGKMKFAWNTATQRPYEGTFTCSQLIMLKKIG